MYVILGCRFKKLNYYIYRKESLIYVTPLKDESINIIRGQTGSSNSALLFHESLNHRPGRDLESHTTNLSKKTLHIPGDHQSHFYCLTENFPHFAL